jgi:hypothetical protein
MTASSRPDTHDEHPVLAHALRMIQNATMRVHSFGNPNIEVVRRDEATAILRDALRHVVLASLAVPSTQRSQNDEIGERWRTGLIYDLRRLAKHTPYQAAPTLIDKAIEAANYLEEHPLAVSHVEPKVIEHGDGRLEYPPAFEKLWETMRGMWPPFCKDPAYYAWANATPPSAIEPSRDEQRYRFLRTNYSRWIIEICCGTYRGQTIEEAEVRLDKAIDGALDGGGAHG